MWQGKLRRNQSGIASIMITMILMVIASLVVLAFAQIARRNERETVDDQLSSQAYYAAESGINTAVQNIKNVIAGNGTVAADNSCDEPAGTLNADLGVAYTCVTVNPTPTALIGTVNNNEGKVFRIKSGTALSTVTISWNNANNNALSGCPGADGEVFSANTSWNCPFGVLSFDLTKTNGVTLTADNLNNNTTTGFITPRNGTGTSGWVNGTSNNQKGLRLMASSCSMTTKVCSITLGGLSGTEYYLSLQTMYAAKADVTITGSAGQTFTDSQIQIDATGKAQDVLRRVRVSMSLTDSTTLDTTAIRQGDGPCKQQFITKGDDGVLSYENVGSCDDDL